MESRFGLLGYSHDGIFFSEGAAPPQGTVKGRVKATSGQQNLNIDTLKSRLASHAKARGANAVVEFKYAQRANAFTFSSTEWRAEGVAMLLVDKTPPPYQAPS
jgi:uncharacterized protein YbjQ (UPF0145 family)